ncbi:MAG TPA: DNA polymerase III subunit beta [Candidatus Paceibacterota bacterium]
MNIECSQEKLKEAISYVDHIANKHITLPVLSCVLLDASVKNSLTIKATNLDLGIEISIPVKTLETGIVAVPSHILNSFLVNALGETVSLKLADGNLQVKTVHNSAIIKTQTYDDFPSIPRVSGGNAFLLNAMDFVKGLKSVWYSSSVSSIKPELSSVYVYCDGEFVVFAATDSFRLAEKRVKLKKNKDFGQILIPYKNIPDIMRVLESLNDEVSVTLDKNQISFDHKGVYLVSRVIDGVFPDYKQIIPKSSTTEVVLLKQDFANALKISNIFSDKFNQINIKVNQNQKKCEVRTKNNDVGENVSVLDAAITGEGIDINFNYKYIVDCLQSVDSDSLTLSFAGLNKPMIIFPVSDTTFRYLVMPMNR